MSLSTHIFVFAIGRGSAAFVRSGLNQGFVLDMGGGDLFDPARFVAKHLVPGLNEYKGNTIAQANPVTSSQRPHRPVRELSQGPTVSDTPHLPDRPSGSCEL